MQLKVNCYTEITVLNPLNVIFNSLKYYNHYFYFLLYFRHMNIFLNTCLGTTCVTSMMEPRRDPASDLLELELPKVISHHAGTEN